MPEVPGNPPSPRAALFWNGTAWQWALVDAAGHLQIDTVTSALPAGAATAANQVIINTTVGLVALIRNALQSVATDRLIVRGEDQLFSYSGTLAEARAVAISGADGWVDSDACPAGEIWCVLNAQGIDLTTATTRHRYTLRHGGVDYSYDDVVAAFGIGVPSFSHGQVWLDPGDTVRVFFSGGLVGDTCAVDLTGYRMTLET